MSHLLRTPLLILVCLFAHYSVADILVIGQQSQPELERHQVEQIFMGKIKSLPGGREVVPLDLEMPDLKEEFYESIARRTPIQLEAYWSRLIFTGQGMPPKRVKNVKGALRKIARNDKYVAYVDSDDFTPTPGLKILYKLVVVND